MFAKEPSPSDTAQTSFDSAAIDDANKKGLGKLIKEKDGKRKYHS
jgi:hypothetical protein